MIYRDEKKWIILVAKQGIGKEWIEVSLYSAS
jgi:hypothetical protein